MSLYTYIKYDTDMWKYIEKVYYADSKLKRVTVSIFITTIKRNKLLIDVTKCIQKIMLNERNQTTRVHTVFFHLYDTIENTANLEGQKADHHAECGMDCKVA